MDIQRGDQVYYRGEVWTVLVPYSGSKLPAQVELHKYGVRGEYRSTIALMREVRRVEQRRCDRCGQTVQGIIMSFFNTQKICPACRERERAHPRYEEARQAEAQATRAGNFNFPGIGLPAELGEEITRGGE